MGTVVALSSLLEARQVWRGWALPPAEGGQPTGWPLLDAALPTRGWPEASLTEILLPADGVGELRVVLPTLARLTQGQRPVVLIAPPYAPCAMGWRQQGVNLQRVDIVDADEKQVLWAAEQCLRSGSCAAVLAWPQQADDRSLRRLQVAADTGCALAFVFRDRRHLANASPAALRLEIAASPQPALWVRKCRGGNVSVQPISFEQFDSPSPEGLISVVPQWHLTVTPAKAGAQRLSGAQSLWVPAFAGMTSKKAQQLRLDANQVSEREESR